MTNEEKNDIRQHGYEVVQYSAYNNSWWQILQSGNPIEGEYGEENTAWSRAKDLINADKYNH
ncbi:hypothetical protein [Pseudomonas sp. NPDC099000]|uniref:hypothetical protein n=1 Tax=Pseudomonas sp. NPDC099000 TaxID=3364488 RepID=UPI00383AB6C9